jgi:DNA helicase HerA-like ATPase
METYTVEPDQSKVNVIGYITYDDDTGTNGHRSSTSCSMVCERARPLRGTYLRMANPLAKDWFVGRIVDGPFISREPGAYYFIELTSMVVDGQKGAVRNRPDPGTPVSILPPDEVQGYIGALGDFKVGRLLGQHEVEVALDSSTLNRHIGVFGTTGSGKSNSLQVIAEEISGSNRSVLIFDIEGEYVKMDEPTDSLQSLLAEFGKKPTGIRDFHVYVPAPNQSRNLDAKKFAIPFADLDLEIFSEVLGLSPLERIYMLDIARKTKENSGSFQPYKIGNVLAVLKKRIDAQLERSSLPEAVAEAHMALYTKLSMVNNSSVLDSCQTGETYDRILPETLCVPGRISVIDLSESSDIVRNVTISHMLREIFRYKTRVAESVPILIFIEEIHTFLSKAKRKTMTATLTMLTEMARQGRKRGIGLGLVSQQPALVPSELIELCNTRLMHRISSEPNIEVLRKGTANVPESLWSLLPSLGNGEVLISSPKFHHSVVARIRPNMSKRLRTEYA